jgi:hypothetical protein
VLNTLVLRHGFIELSMPQAKTPSRLSFSRLKIAEIDPFCNEFIGSDAGGEGHEGCPQQEEANAEKM